MASINEVTLLGHLGRDPELRQTNNGQAACNISMATSRRWTDKQSGEKVEKTEWHRVVFFGRSAEVVAQYTRKGSQLYVRGRLETRKWTDKDGIDKYVTEIVAESCQFVDKRQDNGSAAPAAPTTGDAPAAPRSPATPAAQAAPQRAPAAQAAPAADPYFDDDIPF